MKKGARIAVSALLTLILVVSAGISGSLYHPPEGEQQEPPGAEQQELRTVSVRNEAPVPTETGTDGAEQTLAAGEPTKTANTAAKSTGKPIGKTHAELYPDYVAGGYDLSAVTPSEGKVIATPADYYAVAASAADEEDAPDEAALPASVDNSTSDAFPQIDSQGQLGSCTTW